MSFAKMRTSKDSNMLRHASMDIYAILSSKPHNPHHLKRYIKFIEYYKMADEQTIDIERHHICPKAYDLFPEYTDFKIHSWNKINLTRRQHLIAHRMLYKTFGGTQLNAYFFLLHINKIRKNTDKEAEILYRKRLSEFTTKRNYETILDGTHPFMQEQFKKTQSIRFLNDNPMLNPESREKVRQSKLGEKNPFFGKLFGSSLTGHTNETKQRLSTIAKNRPVFFCECCGRSIQGVSNWNRHLTSKKHSEFELKIN